MAKTPEGELRTKIRKFVDGQAGVYRFSPVSMGFGARTVDDLLCVRGRFVALEYKAPGKRPTAKQYDTLDRIMLAGGRAWWGDNWQSFYEFWCG